MDKASIMEREASIERPVEQVEEEIQHSLIDWKAIWKPLCLILGVFLVFFWLPIDNNRFTGAVIESLALAKRYAQEHVLLCLVRPSSLPVRSPVSCPRQR